VLPDAPAASVGPDSGQGTDRGGSGNEAVRPDLPRGLNWDDRRGGTTPARPGSSSAAAAEGTPGTGPRGEPFEHESPQERGHSPEGPLGTPARFSAKELGCVAPFWLIWSVAPSRPLRWVAPLGLEDYVRGLGPGTAFLAECLDHVFGYQCWYNS
jgi:hypothetical protein